MVTAAVALTAGSAFATGPEDAVNAALGGVETSATAVIGTAGAIIVGLAILRGLWSLGAKWAGRAASGRS